MKNGQFQRNFRSDLKLWKKVKFHKIKLQKFKSFHFDLKFRKNHNTKTFDKSWQTFFVPCLNFPPSFLMGKSKQNKQCLQIYTFCLISFLFDFQRTRDRVFIYRFPNNKGYFLRFQIIMSETLKKMKSHKNQVFSDIVCFDLIYHSEKKRGNSNRGKSCPPRFVKGFCILYLL